MEKKLTKSDYDRIAHNALSGKTSELNILNTVDDIVDYFGFEYDINHDSNPDFISELFEAITHLMPSSFTTFRKDDLIRAHNTYVKHKIRPVSIQEEIEGDLTGVAHKIVWNGQINQFAELLVELEKGGWIENIEDGKLAPLVRTLCSCFDFSKRKKKKDSDTEKTLLQYLKPSERPHKLHTKRYKPMFNAILTNSKFTKK